MASGDDVGDADAKFGVRVGLPARLVEKFVKKRKEKAEPGYDQRPSGSGSGRRPTCTL